MYIKPKRICKDTVLDTTLRNKNYVKELEKRIGDFYHVGPSVDVCAYCRWIVPERVGGASITRTECAICGKELLFGNTCVDVLCESCAKENSLCKHCGGDIELKARRKARPYEIR